MLADLQAAARPPDTIPTSALLAETAARVGPLDTNAIRLAQARLDSLTKPPGSLGRLEELALQLAGITGQISARLEQRLIYVFAADHGVVAERVSAYPAVVTCK